MSEAKDKKLLGKKVRKFISVKKNKEFNISYLHAYSNFIIDLKNPFRYFHELINKNSIKLNNDEYVYLHKTIHDLLLQKYSNKNIVNFIEIPKFICNEINDYFKVNTKRNKVDEFI